MHDHAITHIPSDPRLRRREVGSGDVENAINVGENAASNKFDFGAR